MERDRNNFRSAKPVSNPRRGAVSSLLGEEIPADFLDWLKEKGINSDPSDPKYYNLLLMFKLSSNGLLNETAVKNFDEEKYSESPGNEDGSRLSLANIALFLDITSEEKKDLFLKEQKNSVKIGNVKYNPDKIISVSLHDIADQLSGYDPSEPDAIANFCSKIETKDIKVNNIVSAGKKHLVRQKLSEEERLLIEEIHSQSLPLWIDRKRRKDDLRKLPAPLYFAVVYGEWMGPNLTRKVLNVLDPDLTAGITNWQRDHGGKLPDGIILPNELTETRAWVERVNAGLPVEQETDPKAIVRNAHRLKRAADRKSR